MERVLSLTRRKFLQGGAATAAGVVLAGPARLLAAAPAPKIRTITYNVYGCYGFAEAPQAKAVIERAAPQIPSRLAMELALYEPDIVTFQESPSQETVEDIARSMNMRHGFFPSPYRSKRKDSIGFPGAILTRFTIREIRNCPLPEGNRPEELFTRHWGKAALETPQGELIVYSAHLHPSDNAVRAREVDLVLAEMKNDLRRGAPLLFQGDLNHVPERPEYNSWVSAGLKDAWEQVTGPARLTFNSHKPFKRIDYVWSAGPLSSRLRECRVLHEGAFRTYREDPRSFALSDHIPVLAGYG